MDSATAVVSLFWAGILVGVSFLATPAKFQASLLDLPTALEVGKVTFALFTRVEWGLAALLGLFILLGRATKLRIACTAAIITLVLMQALWLLPILDARVEAIIAGAPLPPSRHHLLYGVAEAAKLVVLGTVAALALGGLSRRRPADAN